MSGALQEGAVCVLWEVDRQVINARAEVHSQGRRAVIVSETGECDQVRAAPKPPARWTFLLSQHTNSLGAGTEWSWTGVGVLTDKCQQEKVRGSH